MIAGIFVLSDGVTVFANLAHSGCLNPLVQTDVHRRGGPQMNIRMASTSLLSTAEKVDRSLMERKKEILLCHCYDGAFIAITSITSRTDFTISSLSVDSRVRQRKSRDSQSETSDCISMQLADRQESSAG